MVGPKKIKLAEAEETLASTMELLNIKRAELSEIEEKVAMLTSQLIEMNKKKAQLEFQVSLFINMYVFSSFFFKIFNYCL